MRTYGGSMYKMGDQVCLYWRIAADSLPFTKAKIRLPASLQASLPSNCSNAVTWGKKICKGTKVEVEELENLPTTSPSFIMHSENLPSAWFEEKITTITLGSISTSYQWTSVCPQFPIPVESSVGGQPEQTDSTSNIHYQPSCNLTSNLLPWKQRMLFYSISR